MTPPSSVRMGREAHRSSVATVAVMPARNAALKTPFEQTMRRRAGIPCGLDLVPCAFGGDPQGGFDPPAGVAKESEGPTSLTGTISSQYPIR